MMLFHILMSVLDHELMLDNFLITSSVVDKKATLWSLISLSTHLRLKTQLSQFPCTYACLDEINSDLKYPAMNYFSN